MRLGYEIYRDLNNYLKKHDVSQVTFMKEAVSFWLSVNRKGSNLKSQLTEKKQELKLTKRILRENISHSKNKIKDLEAIISEKEKRIKELSDHLEEYKKE